MHLRPPYEPVRPRAHRGLLDEADYAPVADGAQPDVVVFSTCAVRESADNKLDGEALGADAVEFPAASIGEVNARASS